MNKDYYKLFVIFFIIITTTQRVFVWVIRTENSERKSVF